MTDSKTAIRHRMHRLRRNLGPDERQQYDRQVSELLIAELRQNDYRIVNSFLPLPDEVDIMPVVEDLLERGVLVVAPKTLESPYLQHLVLTDLNNLEVGKYATKHPAEGEIFTGTYDAILVPGLAFDHRGYRIGYGAGYYDHFLRDQHTAIKIGVGYGFQYVPQIPVSEHDVPVDVVITNEGISVCA